MNIEFRQAFPLYGAVNTREWERAEVITKEDDVYLVNGTKGHFHVSAPDYEIRELHE